MGFFILWLPGLVSQSVILWDGLELEMGKPSKVMPESVSSLRILG